MSYNQQIKQAIESSLVHSNNVFYFESTLYEKLYKDFYLFCRKTLDYHFTSNDISNTYFVYHNESSINAIAKTSDNQSAILVNVGLMESCIEKYFFNHDLNNFIGLSEPTLNILLDSSLSYISFQLVTQFTFYHELAHLFQFSKKRSEYELQERNVRFRFDLISHKLEINADTYSSLCIASHINQYIARTLDGNYSQYFIAKVITLLGACLLDYMMSFINESEIYIEKYSHPHPVVRLLNILLNITNYFSLLPKYKNIGIELCPISLLRAIINFHNKLSSKNIFPIGLSTYIYENNINTPRLLSYINTINNWEEFNGHTDAMTVWNRHVDSNNN